MKTAFLSLLVILFTVLSVDAQTGFVQVKGEQFRLNNQPYYYAGTNYWYGSLIALQPDSNRGILRLRKELDFLQQHHITNLRITAGAEGTGTIQGVPRIGPALQPQQGVFNDSVLYSLDILLYEMSLRKMRAVVMLSNNWEWSGGFLQYLNWNGLLPDSLLQRKLSWDSLRNEVSKFYSSAACVQAYLRQVEKVVTHTNPLTGMPYVKDTTIMAWELANEPRPMRPSAVPAYLAFIDTASAFIRSLDGHHLITTGSEGSIGSETMEVFQKAHALKNIDYLTIHIWPKNWGWLRPDSMQQDLPQALAKTDFYVKDHIAIAQKLQKPLVLEEFGLPRDDYAFSPSATTTLRDEYYKQLFTYWKRSVLQRGPVAGINFWAFGGQARPMYGQYFWKEGDDYMGDPPMEEQGLYSLFDSDASTWKAIDEAIQQASLSGKMKGNYFIKNRKL